jgi:HAD superfamily hydrolase (TIGR01509 family)
MLRALIWDVDGTIAETERDGHLVAFNQAFAAVGLPWRWSDADYAALLRITGGRERLLHDMAGRAAAPPAGAPREALARELHRRKNHLYGEIVAGGGIPARPGVMRLVDECAAAGVALAVATTTSRANVDALFSSLWGPRWRGQFGTVVCAEDAPAKKPDPLAYTLALQRLGMAPHEGFALEDSPNGLRAARAAGLRCGITRSRYFGDAAFEGAHWVRDALDGHPPMTLARLERAGSGSIGA